MRQTNAQPICGYQHDDCDFMIGISSTGKAKIATAIEDMFDRLALQLLGEVPKLKNKKLIIITTKNEFSLAHLFVAAMKNKSLNDVEKDVLKGVLDTAYGYLDSLKSRTQSNVTERVDALIKESKARNLSVSMDQVSVILRDEMEKAKSHIRAIAESESTKARNMGVAMDITRVAADLSDNDPTVFFVIVRDGKTCNDCLRLHMMPDEVTPRLWKLSELKQSYGKRGDAYPSIVNRHPHCRCQLTYLSKGFGFNARGYISYVAQGHDAIADQR